MHLSENVKIQLILIYVDLDMLKSSRFFCNLLLVTFLLLTQTFSCSHRWSLRCPESPTTALHRSKASGNCLPPHMLIVFPFSRGVSRVLRDLSQHSLGLHLLCGSIQRAWKGEAVGTDCRICVKAVGQNPWSVWLSLPSGVLARREPASLLYRRLGSLPVSLFAQSIRPALQIKPFIQQGNELMEQAIRRFARAGQRRDRSAISRFSVTDWGVPKSLPVLTGHTAAERWPKYCLLICQSQDSVIRSGRIKWFSMVNVGWSN